MDQAYEGFTQAITMELPQQFQAIGRDSSWVKSA